MPNGVERHSKVSCDDLHTLCGQGNQSVRLGSAAGMWTHSHTNGNSDETSAARSSNNVPSRSARNSSISPLLSGAKLEQVSQAVSAPAAGVERWQVRALTNSPATAEASRAAEAATPLLNRRVQGMMPVRSDNGDFVSLTHTATGTMPVRDTRYFRIGKVPIVKLDDPRSNRLPPYANTRPGTVRIAPPDDVPLSAILAATAAVPNTSKELLKKQQADITSVLQVLKAKSRKRCLLDRCDSSYTRAGSNSVDQSNDYFSADAATDQRRDSKRRRLEQEEEEDEEEPSCEAIEMTTACTSSPASGTKWLSEAADSASGKNRAGPAHAKRAAGLDSASRRNAIASSYSALLRPKSLRHSGAVDLSVEEHSEDSVSKNGSTILVKSLVGSATQRSGTPASAAGGVSSSRSLVSDAAATDGGTLEPKVPGEICETPPSSGRISLKKRNPEIFYHLTDHFKKLPKATFTPSLEDYAIDELADRERLSKMVGGIFKAPAASVAMAAVAAGKPQLSAVPASGLSSISAADKVPALASTLIVPSLTAPGESSALGLRTTTTSAEKTTSAPPSFSIGSANVSSGNRSNSTIAPPGGPRADGGAVPPTSSTGPLQPADVSSVSTLQLPPPPTYASATASSGSTAAPAVPVSEGMSSAILTPAQVAATSDQAPARPPLLFGGAGVSSAATLLGGQAAAVTALSSGTSFAQSTAVPSSAQPEIQPASAGLAALTKVMTARSGTAALSFQSLGQPSPFAASSVATAAAPSSSSPMMLPSQATTGGPACATTTAAAAGSLSSASTTTSSIGATSTAAGAAAANASGVATFSLPSAFTSGSGSLFGAASRLEHASSTAAVSAPGNPATTSLAPAVTAAPSLLTFGGGSASLFGSSFGAKPSAGDAVDGGAQKQLTFTFGSATKGALPAATASPVPATSSAPAALFAPATSSTPATSSVPAAAFAFGSGLFGAAKDNGTVAPGIAAAAPAAAPTFAFGSGLLGAAKDKDAAAAGNVAAAATQAPTFTFGSGLFGAVKDKDVAVAGSVTAAATPAPTFAFGSTLFGAAKDKDSLAPSAASAAAPPAASAPTFSFGGGAGGSSGAAKDVLGTSSSAPRMTFAFGSGRPFGAAKDAATAAGTFGTGSVFGGAAASGGNAGAAAQPPAFGSGSAAPAAAAVLQPSSCAFGAATAVKGFGGTFGGSAGSTSASAVGSAPILFGVSSSSAAALSTTVVATTAAGSSGLPAASATVVAPSFGIFGSTALPAAPASASSSGASSSVFGGLFGAGKVAAAATTAGGGLQPALPFAFGKSAGATSSAGPTPTFGIGQAQLPPPTASAGVAASQQQSASALSGAAQPAGQQQQPSFLFGSGAATAQGAAGSSNLFGTPATTVTPAAFSFGGGGATAQSAAQPAQSAAQPTQTSGFNFGNATAPSSTFVFGAQANSATSGATTPAASAFGVSPASFGATPLSSLPTGDQGSLTNIFTAGSASNSSVRQRQPVRRTGVAGRLGRR